MPNYRLLAISGSLRKDSFNTNLVRAFKAAAPEGTEIDVLDWSDTPMYNQDDEASFPAYVVSLKEKIRAADGIIVSTPEYNRSIPGPLKNVIDWTSRPYGDSAWAGKPVFIVGASGGPAVGTALAQADLKKVMLFNNALVMGQPEFYMPLAQAKFDAEGNLTDEDTKQHVVSHLGAFTTFIEKLR